jgi:hypothetical protein
VRGKKGLVDLFFSGPTGIVEQKRLHVKGKWFYTVEKLEHKLGTSLRQPVI